MAKVSSIVFAVVLFCAAPVTAQQLDIFSGRGISDRATEPEPTTKSRWPSFKDFSLGEPPKLFKSSQSGERPFSKLFSEKPSMKLFDKEKFKNSFSLTPKKNPLQGLNDMFPKPDPNRPNFFQQLNSKSKEMVGRTTDWAQRQNSQFKERTSETWDTITRNFQPGKSMEGIRSRLTPPSLNMSQAPAEPKVRF